MVSKSCLQFYLLRELEEETPSGGNETYQPRTTA